MNIPYSNNRISYRILDNVNIDTRKLMSNAIALWKKSAQTQCHINVNADLIPLENRHIDFTKSLFSEAEYVMEDDTFVLYEESHYSLNYVASLTYVARKYLAVYEPDERVKLFCECLRMLIEKKHNVKVSICGSFTSMIYIRFFTDIVVEDDFRNYVFMLSVVIYNGPGATLTKTNRVIKKLTGQEIRDCYVEDVWFSESSKQS